VEGSQKAYTTLLKEILNLGPQDVTPGTFTWKGNKLTAELANEVRGKQPRRVTGHIIVQNNRVTEMLVLGAGLFKYAYPDETTNLPVGIPHEITQIVRTPSGDRCLRKLLIDSLIPGDPNTDEQLFAPKARIDPSVMILHVRSNGVETVQGTNNPLVTRIELEEMAPQARRAAAHLRHTRIVVVGLILGLGLVTAAWLVWKRSK
jgi:hypothetical protein